jgi:hypothetical protein
MEPRIQYANPISYAGTACRTMGEGRNAADE